MFSLFIIFLFFFFKQKTAYEFRIRDWSSDVCSSDRVVPMFDVNAWTIPYSAPMVGAKLVLPGAALDGPSLYELFESEGVTFSGGVPTVWQALLQHLQANQLKLTTLRRGVMGGSAAPLALIEAFARDYDVMIDHAWGMTEISPLGSYNRPKRKHQAWPADRSEEHTSELQSLMRISYAVFCLKKKKKHNTNIHTLLA